ncbi:gamma carbonic anhydrase family protein [Patescibacteria group bacterium]|nr:gamma carbonic anhydrase family protein [Patescibacteria group bacterium]
MKDKKPAIDPSCFVSENAFVIGDVSIGKRSSIWFGAVVRADVEKISIGERTNIQDLCVLHVESTHGLAIGNEVTVGHRAILHGCCIGNRVLVGMGAIIMNGANIGDDCIIGAGALITEKMQIPPRSLVLGMPGKLKRTLTEEEIAAITLSAGRYTKLAAEYNNLCHCEE